MNDKNLGTIASFQGNNPSSHAGSIGGGGSYIDDDGRAVVILVAMPDDGEEAEHDLHEGETFELGPELWEVTKIIDAGSPRWGAELTRRR